MLTRAIVMILLVGSFVSLSPAQETPADSSNAAEMIEVTLNLASALDLAKNQKLEEAEQLLIQTQAILSKVAEPDQPHNIACIGQLATIKMMQRDNKGALPYLTQHLQMIEKALGPEDPKTATAALKVGHLHMLLGDFAAAKPFVQQCVEIQKKTPGPETLTGLLYLSRVYMALGDYDASEPLSQQALQIAEKALGPEHPVSATCIGELANIQILRADYEAAVPLFKRSLEISKKTSGEITPQTANVLLSLGDALIKQYDYIAAEPYIQRAHDILVKTRGAEHPDVAKCLFYLAVTNENLHEANETKRLIENGLQILETAHGAEQPETAQALLLMGQFYLKQRSPSDAKPYIDRAISIYEKVHGAEHYQTATAIGLAALAEWLQGNIPQAKLLQKQAIQINQKTLGNEHIVFSKSLVQLGKLEREHGDYAAAEPLFQQALEITARVLGPEHLQTAMLQNELASVYQAQGKHAGAIELYEQAIQTLQDSSSVFAGIVAGHMADSLFLLDRPDEAVSNYSLSIELLIKSLGKEHQRTIRYLGKFAKILHLLEKPSESADFFDQNQRAINGFTKHVVAWLSESEQVMFWNEVIEPELSAALSFAIHHSKNEDVAALSGTWLLNNKAIVAEALAQVALSSRDANDPQVAADILQLVQRRRQLARLRTGETTDKGTVVLQRQTTELNAIVHGLGKKTESDALLDADRWHKLSEVRNALPPKTLFIDIARFEVLDFKAKKWNDEWLPARYVAWVTRDSGAADAATTMIELGPADEIDGLANRVHELLRKVNTQETNELTEVALHRLAEKIWFPIESNLVEVENIVLSPAGALWLVPWNALPAGSERDDYLIERFSLQYVTSGRDLLRPVPNRQPAESVAMLNPDFDQSAEQKLQAIDAQSKIGSPADDLHDVRPSVSRVHERVLPIKSTIDQAQLANQLRSSNGSVPIVYQGQYGLEHIAKSLVRPRIAIFNTHRFGLPDQAFDLSSRNPFGSSLCMVAFAPDGSPIENPLQRCGLLLAGCNNREPVVGGDDGYLTGSEITGMDLRGTELVVLSCAENGNNGDGFAHLCQAFQLAGARTILTRQWHCETDEILDMFFKNLTSGTSHANALRQSQLSRIKDLRQKGTCNPYDWASFTLTGQD